MPGSRGEIRHGKNWAALVDREQTVRGGRGTDGCSSASAATRYRDSDRPGVSCSGPAGLDDLHPVWRRVP